MEAEECYVLWVSTTGLHLNAAGAKNGTSLF
jgi:hypothetical protein